MKQKLSEMHAKARAAVAHPVSIAEVGAKLSVKDRQRLEQQIAALEARPYPGLGARWHRLVCMLFPLAPHMPKLTGLHTIQFFVPDGKYRKQMFAMHAMENGSLTVYAPNIVDKSVSAGIFKKPAPPDASYRVAHTAEPVGIDALDGSTPDAEAFYKDMTGWNRKAVRITLSPVASDAQVQAVEDYCGLASLDWR